MTELIQLFNAYNIPLTILQAEQFDKYFQLLIEWNAKMNLTAITEQREVYVKHFLDSALPYLSFPSGSTVVDIGCGAGFPGIPLAILLSEVNFTLVDSLNKRINFISVVKESLCLNNITAYHFRAEDFAINNREKFDFAIARAVASLPTLLEYLSPFVMVGGKVITYKGKECHEEIKSATSAMQALHLSEPISQEFSLPDGMGERAILTFTKMKKSSPIYPRGGNRPRLQPL